MKLPITRIHGGMVKERRNTKSMWRYGGTGSEEVAHHTRTCVEERMRKSNVIWCHSEERSEISVESSDQAMRRYCDG